MPSNPEMDLTCASGESLATWYNLYQAGCSTTLYVMRDLIVKQARAQWEQERGTPLSEQAVENVARNYVPEGWKGGVENTDVVLSLEDRMALVRAGAALSPAPDVRALQRRAAEFGLAQGWPRYDADNPAARKAWLDRGYPDPAPPSVTLSNKEVVTFDGKVRYRGYTWDTVAAFLQRDNERGYVLTDAEISALYALAASHGGR